MMNYSKEDDTACTKYIGLLLLVPSHLAIHMHGASESDATTLILGHHFIGNMTHLLLEITMYAAFILKDGIHIPWKHAGICSTMP